MVDVDVHVQCTSVVNKFVVTLIRAYKSTSISKPS